MQLQEMHRSIKGAFGKVKEELDNHLDTINQNSVEIQSLYEYLVALEKKMDKLSERLDTRLPMQNEIEPLTSREQEIFLLIYASDAPLRTSLIASRLDLAEDSVIHYIRSMVTKGIPLVQQAAQDDVLISLEAYFKEMQARQSIVRVDKSVSRQVLQEEAI